MPYIKKAEFEYLLLSDNRHARTRERVNELGDVLNELALVIHNQEEEMEKLKRENRKLRGEPEKICCICLEENKVSYKCQNCSQDYHKNCLNEWFEHALNCPNCRCSKKQMKLN
jgi:hypothetical protein